VCPVIGDDDKSIIVFGCVEGKRPLVECVIHYFCCVVFVVEWRGRLSETIMGVGMRECGREGKECGVIGKTRQRAF
jgi:hypothetical protein